MVDWQPLSNCLPFQQLVQQMMQPSFRARPRVEQVMVHDWWKAAGKEATSPVSNKAISDLGKLKPTSLGLGAVVLSRS